MGFTVRQRLSQLLGTEPAGSHAATPIQQLRAFTPGTTYQLAGLAEVRLRQATSEPRLVDRAVLRYLGAHQGELVFDVLQNAGQASIHAPIGAQVTLSRADLYLAALNGAAQGKPSAPRAELSVGLEPRVLRLRSLAVGDVIEPGGPWKYRLLAAEGSNLRFAMIGQQSGVRLESRPLGRSEVADLLARADARADQMRKLTARAWEKLR